MKHGAKAHPHTPKGRPDRFSRSRRDAGPRTGTARRAFVWAGAGVLLALGIGLLVTRLAHGSKAGAGGSRSSATSRTTSGKTPVDLAANPSTNQLAKARDNKVAALVNRGTEALERGNPAEAVLLYQEALQIKPDDEDLHYNLGIAYARQDMTDKALEHYSEALRLFPDYVEVHNNLGNLLMRKGRLGEAVDHFRAAVKIMPDYASGHNNLGTALQQQGQLDEATRQFEKAVALNPDYWEARYNLGQSYVRQGHTQKGKVELEKVLEARPDFAPARQALQRAGEPPPAPEPTRP